MTIFDIKPYSFWRNMYRAAFRGWVNLGQDTPRTVLRLCLLEYIVRYQQDIIDRLSQQNDLEATKTGVRRPNTPASATTHEIAAIRAATNESEATAYATTA
jgi:hypothetical protein